MPFLRIFLVQSSQFLLAFEDPFDSTSQLTWTEFPQGFGNNTQLCPTLCDPMNSSTPGLPVHHQLPEFTQTHVH